ncbi:MAG: inorganic phosphate transporter [Solirubrobacteraceae bacterium]|jgi:PiT family inorganic phosphate transporter
MFILVLVVVTAVCFDFTNGFHDSANAVATSIVTGALESTTHVVSGGVMGAGAGKRLASVHWGVAGQMATAWLVTIPAAGIMGAAAREVARLFGANSSGGVVVMALITAAAAAVLFQLAARRSCSASCSSGCPGAPRPAPRSGAWATMR